MIGLMSNEPTRSETGATPRDQPTPEPTAPGSGDKSTTPETRSRLRARAIRTLKIVAVIVGVWLLLAYFVLPFLWRHYEHNPGLADAPKTTVTSQGIPGDPINVGLVGGERALVRAMLEAGWSPADPITLKSSLRIAESVVLKRPDPNAPVSNLFLFGRRQDLAFEKAVGGNARQRHHVRFWQWNDGDNQARPLWIGAATFDHSVGLSHRTGQVTHHIAPNVDAERDQVIKSLESADRLVQVYQVTGVGATLLGRNGGGDRYYTDGEVTLGVLTAGDSAATTLTRLANPPAVQIKQQLWSAIRPLIEATAQ